VYADPWCNSSKGPNGKDSFVRVQCFCEILDGRRDPQITYSLCAYKCVEMYMKIRYENRKENGPLQELGVDEMKIFLVLKFIYW
jgi:hypothetical protein